MDYISNIFAESQYKHDRFFNESFELPYNFDQIKIQPNELSTFRSLNLSIEKLYENFLYIFSLTELGNNIVPIGMPSIAGAVSGVTDNTFTWIPSGNSLADMVPFSAVGLPAFDNATINQVEYSPFLNCDIIITCSPTTVILSKSTRNNSSISVLLSTSLVDIDQHLTFQNIVGTAFYNNSLYIADGFYNSVYQYDLTELFTDQIYPNGLVLTKAIGGTGNAEKKYQFNGISGLTIFNDIIYS